MNWIRAQAVASAAGLLAYLLVGRKPYTSRSHRSECVVGQTNSKLFFSSMYQISLIVPLNVVHEGLIFFNINMNTYSCCALYLTIYFVSAFWKYSWLCIYSRLDLES